MIPTGNYFVLIAVSGMELDITTHKRLAALATRNPQSGRRISGLSGHAGQADCQFVDELKLLIEAKAAGNARTSADQ